MIRKKQNENGNKINGKTVKFIHYHACTYKTNKVKQNNQIVQIIKELKLGKLFFKVGFLYLKTGFTCPAFSNI